MENFKFIASFENDPHCDEIDSDENDSSYESDCKLFLFDILSVIQYYCLQEILLRFGIVNDVSLSYNLYLFDFIYFKNGRKGNISELQNFIAYFNQFFNFNVSTHCGYIFLDNNDRFTFNKLINKITEDILINDFDKYINAYDINKYTKLYIHGYYSNGKLSHYIRAFMGNEVCISFLYDFDKELQFDNLYPIIADNNIKLLISECKEHLINNQGIIDNTMSEHIVYTSDLEVTKQVLRNNQKIINNIIKNLKNETSDEVSNSNKQKLMQLLTSEEIKPEVKPKQRTKITL